MLEAINLLLGTKIVQYLLCLLLVALIVTNTLTGLKYWALKEDHKFVLGQLVTVSADLQKQNTEIQQMADQSEKYLQRYNMAADKAAKIAVETQNTLKDIVDYQFEGQCSEMVQDGLRLLKGDKK